MRFAMLQLLIVIFPLCAMAQPKKWTGNKKSNDDEATSSKKTEIAANAHIVPMLSEETVPIKIRVLHNSSNQPRHAYVVVGNYEFDMSAAGARRRKFRFDIDNLLNVLDERRAQPFKSGGIYTTPTKAEKVFFEMSERFWFAPFNHLQANCLDYVFNFVNALCDGTAPRNDIWPDNFIEFDKNMISSNDYQYPNDIIIYGVRDPVSALNRPPIKLPELPIANDPDQNCTLKYHRLKLSIKNNKSPDLNEDSNSANFVLHHITGRFTQHVARHNYFEDRIEVQTVPEEISRNGKMINLEFVLKAYSCKMSVDGFNRTKTYVKSFVLKNETATKYIVPKSTCHPHNFLHHTPINLDELTDHVVQIEFDGWNIPLE